MKQIYLINKKNISFDKNTKKIYLKDVFNVYPDKEKNKFQNIEIVSFDKTMKGYYVITLGDVINRILEKYETVKINFMDNKDVLIHFIDNKKDKTIFLRVLIISITLFFGAAMAIINFHADVDMRKSHQMLINFLTGSKKHNYVMFEIPYSLGLGLGVAIFYNRFIPGYSKSEPSPLELETASFRKDVEDFIIDNQGDEK